MRVRLLLIGSLGLNVLLATVWWHSRARRPETQTIVQEGTNAPGESSTNVVVRRQYFTWSEVESKDYPVYIENLRNIGCPEETIRDIIVADVDELFDRRRATEVVPVTRQWWQSQADPKMLQLAQQQLRKLEDERVALLTRLLGPGWNTPDPATQKTVALQIPLDGPTLGTLPDETKKAVEQLSGRTQREYERILEEARRTGTEPDASALASLFQRLSNELAKLLSPSQLEAFQVRYSPVAHKLRAELNELEFMKITPEEFRRLFRGVESIDLQLMALTGDDPATVGQREALLKQRENAFRNALGPARYADYERLQDPGYRGAVAAAQAAGNTNLAGIFYAIEQLGSNEQASINASTDRTALQREIELKQLELDQLKAAAVALGEEPPPEPVPETPPIPRQTYVFQEGDTLPTVARRYGVPVMLLLQSNPQLRQLPTIPPGTEIVIPQWNPPAQ